MQLLTITNALDARPWEVDVTSPYHPAIVAQLKAMPGMRWLKAHRVWRGPYEAVKAIASTLEHAKIVKVKDTTRAPSAFSFAPDMPEGAHSYQREGVAWLADMLTAQGAALLADEMGLGKTLQAITALSRHDSVIVTCPAVVRSHWLTQLTRWHPRGPEHNWHVDSYEKITKAIKANTLPAASAFVIDEGHYLMNPKAQRTKAIASWLATHEQVTLMLTGTPMTTRPRDLWQPLDLLWPGRFGNWFQFTKRYCDGHYQDIPNTDKSVWVSDGKSNIDELAQRLQACMLRRTKRQVALELPPLTRVPITVELPKAAARDLRKAAKLINWESATHNTHVGSLLSNVEGYKVARACELAQEVLASGSRPLLLTTRKQTAADIAKLLQCPMVTGDLAPELRASTLSLGDNAGVATLHSVTTGIDLTEFSVVIMVGLDYVPSRLLQGEARIHRLGQAQNVTVYYLIGAGTIDEVIREKVIERLDVFATLSGAHEGDEREFASALGESEDDLINGIVNAVRGML